MWGESQFFLRKIFGEFVIFFSEKFLGMEFGGIGLEVIGGLKW